MITPPSAPQSETELLDRCEALVGLNLAQLAQAAGITTPANLQREKGWQGQLLEWHLGATAGSKPVPDFELIGVELKTIPIDRTGKPLETTYVCVVPLTDRLGVNWQQSNIRQKLNRVLWLPILAERSIPIGERVVGYPILWSPTPEQDAALQADWEELMEMIALGQISQVTARHGEVLQIRPKAANASIRTQAYDNLGNMGTSLPRGFYLRKNFTSQILQHM